jgi:hypothetical protein
MKGTISVHYTLWDPIFLHNVRKNFYKSYLIFSDSYKYFYANYVHILDPIMYTDTDSIFYR